MAKRKSTGKRSRFEVFKRDGFTCQYCGRTPPTCVLEIDHITPISKGGTSELINLITACADCNRGKSDRELTAIPESLQSQMEDQKERRKQIEEYNRFLMALRKKAATDINDLGVYWHDLFREEKGKWTCGPARSPSLRNFLARLPKAEIMDAMDIAIGRVPPHGTNDHFAWKYFCGVCWRKIKEAAGNG